MTGQIQHHIRCRPGEVGRYVLLPGDPKRSARIAAAFDDARLVADHREFVTYTGTLLGEAVSVTSTGIGCPSTAIAVEELAAIGAATFIRVGTCGGMQRHVLPGDLVIASAAIRDEGTSRQYLPLAFPAVADPVVTGALAGAARAADVRHHVGIVQSKDAFYAEWAPERMPLADELIARNRAWKRGGAIGSEMEASTLFVVASVLGARAGGIMRVGGNPELGPRDPAAPPDDPPLDDLIATAIAGLKLLIRRDRGEAPPSP
jgi:uridine phosphorylase